MKKLFLRGSLSLLVLVVLVAAYIQFTLVSAGGGLPAWDRDVIVEGVDSDVTISRDEHGNPHIVATTEGDLYFAQGFVHAQDRFWQMAMTRQMMLGRLSEWFGSPTLASDRVQRMFSWRELAETSYATLSTDDKRLIEAYAAGVNAWLDSDAYRRPPEMRILHIHPERWSPVDSFVISNSFFLLLATTGSESTAGALSAADLAPDVMELLSSATFEAPLIIGSSSGDTVSQISMPVKEKAFSNNWTVSGAHTASGLPLMANDPQLPIALPNTWQLQAHHLNDSLRAGGTFPGIPSISIGHNSSVAWGITNAVIDAIDLAYLEKHPTNPSLYRRGPDQDWESYIEREELIKVRFGADHKEIVRLTPKGRVWPDGVPSRALGARTDVALEARTVFHEAPGKSIAAFLTLNRISSVEEGIAAIRDVSALALSFSFADIHGDIGFVASGNIAVRDPSHATTVGLYPDDDNDWELLDFDANPRMINPPEGRIVSANQQIVGDDYPHYLTDVWAAPYRAWRIHELLDETETHDAASFLAMQSDALSPQARRLTPLMLNVEPADTDDAALVAILRDWDFQFTLDAPAPVIWATWMRELRRDMIYSRTESISSPNFAGAFVAAERALSGEKPDWCDNPATDETEDCKTMLEQTLSAARLTLEERLGQDPSAWQWGEIARFRHPHLGFDALPLLGSRFSRESAIRGGPGSMFTNGMDLDEAPEFSRNLFASSFQGIYDLSDLRSSLFIASSGTSGHYRSPHYDDMTERWLAHERITLGDVPEAPTYQMRLRRSTTTD